MIRDDNNNNNNDNNNDKHSNNNNINNDIDNTNYYDYLPSANSTRVLGPLQYVWNQKEWTNNMSI